MTDKDLQNTLMITYDVQNNMHYHDPNHPDFHKNINGHAAEVQEKIDEARAAIMIQKINRKRTYSVILCSSFFSCS